MIASVGLGEILWSLLVIYFMVMYVIIVFTVWIDTFSQEGEYVMQGREAVVGDFFDFLGDLVWRQDDIDRAVVDSIFRHASVLCGVVLSEGEAPASFDRGKAEGAVSSRA